MGLELSIVVPVYRSQSTLRELYRRIKTAMDLARIPFEIIFVEDGGGDDSWNIIKSISVEDSRIFGIKLGRNYGQHNALLCGIRAAQGRVIVTLDDDLQNPPEEIPKLLDQLNRGCDVVYGYPEVQTHGFLRNSASRITKLALGNMMGVEVASKTSAFRAFRGYIKESFVDYRSPAVNIEVLLTWGTTRFGHVVVKHDPRIAGESGYSLKKLMAHAINMATGFSTLPLRIASILGILFSLVGVVILIYVLFRYLAVDSPVPGFSFIASIVTIFAGAQLFCLGVIGEYLARMYSRAMEKPAYSVVERVGDGVEVDSSLRSVN
ncbi:MAG: glycosyltransferase family 2 protein [Comamonadaceae bacterium]|nr:glycosyltransferase family 2 protein [Comamonadaceae bacterium]